MEKSEQDDEVSFEANVVGTRKSVVSHKFLPFDLHNTQEHGNSPIFLKDRNSSSQIPPLINRPLIVLEAEGDRCF